ncbi:MAG TPA: hypothetical protein PKO09_05195 [Anaerolineae bacterium]|nr:hypothetical protein [Anaerolineae bacterium]
MSELAPVLLVIGLLLLIARLMKGSGCDHAGQLYYGASGDELPGDQSDACFCKCTKCGRTAVIPSGFQSDAHFDNYLYLSEQGDRVRSQTRRK